MFYDEYGIKINSGSLVHFTNKRYPVHIRGTVDVVGVAHIIKHKKKTILVILVNGVPVKQPGKGVCVFELDNEPCYGVRVL